MAKFNIVGVYEYAGEVEAATEEEALSIFYNNLNDYYSSTESEEVEEVEDDEDEEEN
jgi:hypothetical protein